MLVSRVTDFHYPVAELEPFDFDLLQIVHGEISRREAFHAWEVNKESAK
jgi:hypothetical protein